MADGSAFTVIAMLREHPVDSVYTTVHVPAALAVSEPPEVIVATPGHAADHVPPVGVLLYVTVLPAQTFAGPVMLPGKAFTVATAATPQPEPNE